MTQGRRSTLPWTTSWNLYRQRRQHSILLQLSPAARAPARLRTATAAHDQAVARAAEDRNCQCAQHCRWRWWMPLARILVSRALGDSPTRSQCAQQMTLQMPISHGASPTELGNAGAASRGPSLASHCMSLMNHWQQLSRKPARAEADLKT